MCLQVVPYLVNTEQNQSKLTGVRDDKRNIYIRWYLEAIGPETRDLC